MAVTRAAPSAFAQGPHEVLVGHDPDATIAQVRNELATHATGTWLCFLDADDELAPGYVKAMKTARERNHLLMPIVQQVKRGRPRTPNFYPQVDLLSGNYLVVGTVIERRLFSKAGGFGEYPHGFEDWALWYKATKLGAKVKPVPEAVYVQHVNPRSKHRLGWRDRRYQVGTHMAVQAELEAWVP